MTEWHASRDAVSFVLASCSTGSETAVRRVVDVATDSRQARRKVDDVAIMERIGAIECENFFTQLLPCF